MAPDQQPLTDAERASETPAARTPALAQVVLQMPYPVEVYRPDGTAVMVNTSYLDTFGLPSDDIVVGCYNVFEDPVLRDLGLVDEIRKAFDGSPVHIPEMAISMERVGEEHGGLRKGVEYFEATLFPLVDESGTVSHVVNILKDVGASRRSERLAGALRDLASALASTKSLEEGLAACLETAVNVTGLRSGGAYVLGPAPHRMRLVAHRDLGQEFVRQSSTTPPPQQLVEQLGAGKPYYASTIDMQGPLRAVADAERLKCVAVVPVMHGETVIGSLNLASRTLEEVPEHARVALESIAAQVSGAIERLRAENAVRQSEERFRRLVESSPMGFHMYELRDGDRLVFVGANATADAILGVDNTQFIDKTIEEAFPPLADTEVPERYRRAATTGEPWRTHQINYEDRHIKGAYEVYAFQTRPGAMAVMFLDVTEQKRSEEREQKQKRDLAFLSETAMAFVRFRVQDDIHRFVAEKLREIAGPGAVVVINDHDERTGEFRPHTFVGMEETMSVTMEVLGGHPNTLKYRFGREVEEGLAAGHLVPIPDGLADEVLPDGRGPRLMSALGVESGFTVAYARHRKVYGAAVILVPRSALPLRQSVIEAFMAQASVTFERRRAEVERGKMEEELIHVQKMEAIGTLAGGVAHDFNNLLTCILGYADIITEAPDRVDEVTKAADIIAKTARSAFDLTHQLLKFARKGELQVRAVDVHKIVNETLGLLRRTIDRIIVLSSSLRARSPVVYGDPSQLQQVLMNLAVNARDAMPDGGELVVATHDRELDAEFCKRHREVQPGRYLEIVIRDNGVGMSEEVRRRIFEPFYTTKEKGKGTGMGLVMVYSIVKNHGGAITVTSEPGKGTEFRAYLPTADASPAPTEDEETRKVVRGTGRILVVDDEEDVRAVIQAMLERIGYAVDTAVNGKDGFERYAESWQDVDLVILDLDMPVMGGVECFHKMKEVNPLVKVLVATGYGMESSAQQLLTEGVLHLIHKPFDRARLSEVVAQAFDA